LTDWLLGLLLLCSTATNAEPLRQFEAGYSLLRNDQHIANATFRLAPRHDTWVWSMSTQPRGVYSWLTRKKPFAETHLVETPNGWQPLIEVSGDYPERSPKHAAWFDHANRLIYYAKTKSSKRLEFAPPIYNDHSIHLMYSRMKQQGVLKTSIPFYRNGRIARVKLTLEPGLRLERDGKDFAVDRLTQQFEGSDRKMIYHYTQETLAPLKIEQIKKDVFTVMWREWVRPASDPGKPKT
jgi:hypothetical protein